MIRVNNPPVFIADYGIASGFEFNAGAITILNIPAFPTEGEADFRVNVEFDIDDTAVANGLLPAHAVTRNDLGGANPLEYHVTIALYNPGLTNLTTTKPCKCRVVMTLLANTTGNFVPTNS